MPSAKKRINLTVDDKTYSVLETLSGKNTTENLHC